MAVAAVLGGPAVASGDCPCLVLHLPDGTTQTVAASDVDQRADVHDVQYFLRAVPGGATQDEPYVGTGLSVRHALESLAPPFDPGAVGFTEISRPDGSWSTLTAADLTSPSDFDSGLLPVVRVDGDVLEYVRPLRPGTQDVNVRDLLRGGSLDLYVHTGVLLAVTSSASPTAARPGQAVAFLARASGGPGPFVFTWSFGDGSAATGPAVQHSYASQGSYRVNVTVTGPQDSGGSADPLLVAVTSPGSPTPRPTVPGPQASSSAAPTLGPVDTARPSAPSPRSGAAPSRTSPLPRAAAPTARRPASITGVLISATAPPLATSRVTATPAAGPSRASSSLAAGGAGLGAVVLLALGAARELRRPLRRGKR